MPPPTPVQCSWTRQPSWVFSIRFVPASRAYLSTAYGKPTCYIDVPLLQKTRGDFEILQRFQDELIALGGFPHWGKINTRLYGRPDLIADRMPKLSAWQNVRRQLDPEGTFHNDFLEKMQLV